MTYQVTVLKVYFTTFIWLQYMYFTTYTTPKASV